MYEARSEHATTKGQGKGKRNREQRKEGTQENGKGGGKERGGEERGTHALSPLSVGVIPRPKLRHIDAELHEAKRFGVRMKHTHRVALVEGAESGETRGEKNSRGAE